MADLRLASGVNVERQDDRKSLLSGFDDVRRDLDASGTMKGLDSFNARAFDMIASGAVRKALDLNNEEPRSRDRYKGVEQFLTARRLIEAGVGCVTLTIGGWDTHSSNFKTLRKQLPEVDRGVANLIQDLHDRGMQDDVVTVMWGEFGRTPKINGNDGGRDHWSPAMSALVAGGGLKMGQAIGATSARGEYPTRPPLHRAAAAEHAVPGDRHRPGDDVPQRQRPADVPPRRPRAGHGIAVTAHSAPIPAASASERVERTRSLALAAGSEIASNHSGITSSCRRIPRRRPRTPRKRPSHSSPCNRSKRPRPASSGRP